MLKIREIKVKSIITKSGLPGSDYVINPYIGCLHGCVYCYARFMKRFTNHHEGWGKFLDVKINAPEDDKIRKEIEPLASSVNRRINAVRELKKAGIGTEIFISPIFPYLTDWKEIVEKTKNFVDEFWFENLNLYPSLQYNIFHWLKNQHPVLVKKYQEIYFTKNDYWNKIEKEIKNYGQKNNLNFKIYFHHRKTFG